jgi:hypothetical protein
MALVTSFRYRTDRTINYRTRVECGWTRGVDTGGEQLLQLETYASDGTTSQVLQLDRTTADELVAIIREVFPAEASIT